MAIIVHKENYRYNIKYGSCLAIDIKPTTWGYGSTIYEMDTGIMYLYGAGGWARKYESILGNLSAGEAHIGEVGGNTVLVSITPVVTAGAYHANDIVGGTGAGAGLGINTLANAVRLTGGSGIIQSLVISDLAAQNAVFEIYLFSANPAAGTYTDNGALTIHDTDALLCIGRIDVAAGDYKSLANNSIACVRSIGLPIKVSATSLFVIIRTTGTPTYASTSDLKLTFGILRD